MYPPRPSSPSASLPPFAKTSFAFPTPPHPTSPSSFPYDAHPHPSSPHPPLISLAFPSTSPPLPPLRNECQAYRLFKNIDFSDKTQSWHSRYVCLFQRSFFSLSPSLLRAFVAFGCKVGRCIPCCTHNKPSFSFVF